MRLIIISGLSGSGKSVALDMLEDLDYYCIDNIPAGLLSAFVSETVKTKDPRYERTAVGVDARNRPADIESVPELVAELRRGGVYCEIIFLHADDEVLLQRYSETRRKHPLSRSGLNLREAIAEERELLGPITMHADLIVNTSDTSVHDLRELVRGRIDRRQQQRLALMFESFGFKNGVPNDADFVFDARCLPNPYWEPALRPLTGKDAAVARYLDDSAIARQLLHDLTAFLERWIDEFERSDRSYLTVAIGCTGGQHRSVYLVEKLGSHFAERYQQVTTRHNEISA